MSIFRRDGDKLLYQRNTNTNYTFKRMDYAWRRLADATIRAELPDRDSNRSWFIEVTNGRFTWQKNPSSPYLFVYELPEYLNQNFDPRYPGRQLMYAKETAQIVNQRKIRVSRTPVLNTRELYMRTSAGDPLTWGDERVLDPAPLASFTPEKRRAMRNVSDADLRRGEFLIDPSLAASDAVEVQYHYHPENYTYQGYKGKGNRFYFLDLNPTAGHVVTLESASGNPIDFYTSELLGKSIYLYLMPAYVLERVVDPMTHVESWVPVEDAINRSVLRHTDVPEASGVHGWVGSKVKDVADSIGVTADEVVKLLAEVTLSRNISLNKIQLFDTRSRGGGIRETVKLDALGVEAQYCWDIGYWDGEPYHQNGVVIVRLPKKVLKAHGGMFSEEDVREAVEKHLQLGDLAIIEYVSPTTDRIALPIREVLLPDALDITPGPTPNDRTEYLGTRANPTGVVLLPGLGYANNSGVPPSSGGTETPQPSGGDAETPPPTGPTTAPTDYRVDSILEGADYHEVTLSWNHSGVNLVEFVYDLILDGSVTDDDMVPATRAVLDPDVDGRYRITMRSPVATGRFYSRLHAVGTDGSWQSVQVSYVVEDLNVITITAVYDMHNASANVEFMTSATDQRVYEIKIVLESDPSLVLGSDFITEAWSSHYKQIFTTGSEHGIEQGTQVFAIAQVRELGGEWVSSESFPYYPSGDFMYGGA